MVQGKHFSLPKVWKQSSYSPSLALNVKLISPYGHPSSIKKHILEPLIKLLVLSSATSDDGLTYGRPKYVKVNAYGITNINLGYIESVSINRGGADTTYNRWRQPTSLDLTISIRPSLNGFASVYDETGVISEKITVDTVDTPSDYNIDVSSGPGITTIGNIIKSFRAVPFDIQEPTWLSAIEQVKAGGSDGTGVGADEAGNLATTYGTDFEAGKAARNKEKKKIEAIVTKSVIRGGLNENVDKAQTELDTAQSEQAAAISAQTTVNNNVNSTEGDKKLAQTVVDDANADVLDMERLVTEQQNILDKFNKKN